MKSNNNMLTVLTALMMTGVGDNNKKRKNDNTDDFTFKMPSPEKVADQKDAQKIEEGALNRSINNNNVAIREIEKDLKDLCGKETVANDIVDVASEKIMTSSDRAGTTVLVKTDFFNVIERMTIDYAIRLRHDSPVQNPDAFDVVLSNYVDNLTDDLINRAEKVIFMILDHKVRFHYYLAVYERASGVVKIYDSMPSYDKSKYDWTVLAISRCLLALNYRISRVVHEPCEKQNDSTSCGVFALKNMECIVNEERVPLHGINLAEYRQKINELVKPIYDERIKRMTRKMDDAKTKLAEISSRSPDARTETKKRRKNSPGPSNVTSDIRSERVVTEPITRDFKMKLDFSSFDDFPLLEIQSNSIMKQPETQFKYDPKKVKEELMDLDDQPQPVYNNNLCTEIIDLGNDEDDAYDKYLMRLMDGDEEPEQQEKAEFVLPLRSYLTLNGTRWLNDEVIDAYMCLFRDYKRYMSDKCLRESDWIPRRVLPVLSNFYTRTLKGRILRHESVYAYDFVVFPYQTNSHWKLCIFVVSEERAIIFDSLSMKFTDVEKNQLTKVWDDLRDDYEKEGKPQLTFQVNPDGQVMHQKDSINCGIFVCLHAFYFLGGHYPLPTTIDLKNERNHMMIQIQDCQHIDVKDETGNVLDHRSLTRIRADDLEEAEAWFEKYLEGRRGKGIMSDVNYHSRIINVTEKNDVEDIEMIDVSEVTRVIIEKSENISKSPMGSKSNSKRQTKSQDKEATLKETMPEGYTWNMQMAPDLIDQFFKKITSQDSDCFLFPVSAWTFDDKLESLSVPVSLKMKKRLIIPFLSDCDTSYALLVVEKSEKDRRWRGSLFDRNGQVSKGIRENAKKLLAGYDLDNVTLSLSKKNVKGNPKGFSGIYICSRIVGVVTGKFEDGIDEGKKLVENELDHSVIPWLQNIEVDPTQQSVVDTSQANSQTVRQLANTESKRKSRQISGMEKEYEKQNSKYANEKLGKGRVYVKKEAAYNSHKLPDPYIFPEFTNCTYCNARKFPNEPPRHCCKEGSVILPDELMITPDCMRAVREHLMHDGGKSAMGAIRQINSFVAFVGSNSNFLSPKDLPAGGPVPVILEGEYLNGVCNLLPSDPSQVKFAQLTYCSESTVFSKFKDYFSGSKKKLESSIEKVFIAVREIVNEHNPFAKAYQTMYSIINDLQKKCDQNNTKMPHIQMSLKEKRELDPAYHNLAKGQHPGTTTKPLLDDQVFAIYSTDDGQLDYNAIAKGTFVFPRHSTYRKCQNIVPWSANFFPLKFPFLFFEEQPFNMGLQRINAMKKLKNDDRSLSFREIAVGLLRHCGDIMTHRVLGYGKLTQEFVIALEARDEADKLSYMRKVQLDRAMLKGTTVHAHQEYVASELAKLGIKLGSFVTMTQAYPGGRAHKDKMYHNSMAINRRFGHSHLFITFTGMFWDPIVNNLAPNNTPYDDPMLVVRTFDNCLRELKKDLFERGVLGKPKAWILSKEFQKRGMPHAHILITLDLENGLTEDMIDKMISAEFPKLNENDEKFQKMTEKDKEKEREKWRRLYATVKNNMVHGPCEHDDGTRFSCRKDLKGAPQCAKGYPKPYQKKTTLENGKYANYRRSENGPSVVFGSGKNTRVATNRHVVPHNRWLLGKYGCHINVEVVASIESQRYLHKYVFKGFDQCLAEIKALISKPADLSKVPGMRKEKGEWVYDYDETRMYMMCRVKSAPEAAFRLLAMDHAEMSHVVSALSVHLPGQQRFTFAEEDDDETMEEKAERAKSKFMMYMEACESNLMVQVDGMEVSVRDLTFAEADERLRVKNFKYHPYLKNIRKVTRLNPVSPRRTEQYALYVMVLSAKGYTSFDDLLTDSNGVKYVTFAEAARKKGFLVDETEWEECLERVSQFAFPNQMRSLFATIIIQGYAPDIPKLWKKFKKDLHPRDKQNKMSEEMKDRVALSHLQAILRHHGISLGSCHLPELDTSEVIKVEKEDEEEMREIEEDMRKTDGILTTEQRTVADAVLHSLKNKAQKQLHFLQASGGCGKTVLTNYVINRAILEGRKVVVMASSGVTAILLRNGRTVHSTFGVPLNLKTRQEPMHDSMSDVGKYLRGTELIIWDEAPMQNKYVMYFVNDTMKNIVPAERSHLPFGGVTVLLSGDWKQTLCVVPGVHGKAIIAYTLRGANDLWPLFTLHKLTKNLRVNEKENEFREWLEAVGRGTINTHDGKTILIPENVVAKTKQEVIEHVFPQQVLDNPVELTGRMLLCMKNDQVLSVNDNLMAKFKGEMVEMIGNTEHVECAENESPLDTLEDLQGRTPGGMPPHILKLKKGSPVVLLRNINIVAGLCNGTRLIVEEFIRNGAGNVICIMARNISDSSKNHHLHAIPRIKSIYESPIEGLKFSRTQFPLWPAFAMTVNKAQGQTIPVAGLILESDPFSHGQTYVALSRVRCPADIRIYTPRTLGEDGGGTRIMKNIVYDNMDL